MTGTINFSVVSVLPGTLAPNTEYFIVSGGTFTIVKTDATGTPSTLQAGMVGSLIALGLIQTPTPANPPVGQYKVYVKSDGKLYILNSSGVETQVGGGGSMSGRTFAFFAG